MERLTYKQWMKYIQNTLAKYEARRTRRKGIITWAEVIPTTYCIVVFDDDNKEEV